MKFSYYNEFIKHGDRFIAYNGRTNALAEITNEDFTMISEYSNKTISNIKKDLIEQLLYGGFLIEDDINELDILRYQMFASRFDNSRLSLVVAPTSNCNFRCPYCFESKVLRNSKMDKSIIDAIMEFVNYRSASIQNLQITWYGGEPLLEIDTIMEMSLQFLKLCEESNIKYSSSIITNGYLLDTSIMKKLISVKIDSVQVTLDGLKEKHDKRRFLVGGKPTFETIIRNLEELGSLYLSNTKDFPTIGLRMNIDRDNYQEIDELMRFLYKSSIHEYTYFYIAGVFDKNDFNNKFTFTQAEFIKLFDKYLNLQKSLDKKDYYEDYYPKIISSNCGCDTSSSFVIDSDGTLYKCWEEIGHIDSKIGNIKEILDFNIIKNPWYYHNILNDPTLDDHCSKCKILPNCMGGGCPYRVNNLKFKIDCEAKIAEHKSNIIKSYEILKMKESQITNN